LAWVQKRCQAISSDVARHITALPTLTITARLRDSQTAGDKQPLTEAGYQQVYVIDTRQIAGLTKTPLTWSYLQLVDNQPGGLAALPLPQLDAGPFLSYGIQWIAFGILAPIGLGYFAVTEIRTRRREAAQRSAGTPARPGRTPTVPGRCG
jgi:cytochrome oxidase assembly protein ShyY1